MIDFTLEDLTFINNISSYHIDIASDLAQSIYCNYTNRKEPIIFNSPKEKKQFILMFIAWAKNNIDYDDI